MGGEFQVVEIRSECSRESIALFKDVDRRSYSFTALPRFPDRVLRGGAVES